MDATGSRKLGDQYIDGPGVSKVRGGGFAPTVPMVVAAVVIISASQLPKCTKTRVKSHNIAYNTLKRPNIACETPKHRTGKAYDAPQFKKIFFFAGNSSVVGSGYVRNINSQQSLDRHFTSSVPSLKKIFWIATVVYYRHDASANSKIWVRQK